MYRYKATIFGQEEIKILPEEYELHKSPLVQGIIYLGANPSTIPGLSDIGRVIENLYDKWYRAFDARSRTDLNIYIIEILSAVRYDKNVAQRELYEKAKRAEEKLRWWMEVERDARDYVTFLNKHGYILSTRGDLSIEEMKLKPDTSALPDIKTVTQIINDGPANPQEL